MTSPGLEGDRGADVLDDRRDIEDGVAGVVVLHRDDLPGIGAGAGNPPRPDRQVRWPVELVGGHEHGADRVEGVRALRPEPLAVAVLAFVEGGLDPLPVAGAHVVADDVAGDVGHRVGGLHPAGALADDDAELGLEIQAVGAGRPDDGLAVGDDRGWELGEEERPVRPLDVLLLDVVEVVQPHADRPCPGAIAGAGRRFAGSIGFAPPRSAARAAFAGPTAMSRPSVVRNEQAPAEPQRRPILSRPVRSSWRAVSRPPSTRTPRCSYPLLRSIGVQPHRRLAQDGLGEAAGLATGPCSADAG